MSDLGAPAPAAEHSPAYAPVDLASCEREPIHVPGAVQPHGLLLAVDAQLVVRTCSANALDLVGTPAEQLVGGPLSAVLGPQIAATVGRRIGDDTLMEPLVVFLPELPGAFSGVEVDLALHRVHPHDPLDATVLVELEPIGRPRDVMLTYQSARGAMARIGEATGVVELADRLAHEVRELLAFDRVMVYRFDQDWNGEVIAERRRDDLNAFLGLRYPASDIPPQARRLYTVNWTRLIADVRYAPVPLVPVLDPATGAPLDLSHSTLRSVSPIHLEYLENMGVRASMSISIIVDGALWGLVACHHYAGPHRPAHDARNAAEFLCQVASQQIAESEQAEHEAARLAASHTLNRVMSRLMGSLESPFDSLLNDPDLLSVMDADGVVAVQHGAYLSAGAAPPEHVARALANALLATDSTEPAATDRAGDVLPAAAAHAGTAAGALVFASSPDTWLMWVRGEQVQHVSWGGDPHNKAIARQEGDTVRLSPRKSFEAWNEIVSGRSAPWRPWHAEVARELRAALDALLLTRVHDQVVVAESLQRSVLGTGLPTLEGYDVAVRYEPASSYALGGDWWDWMALPDGRIGLVVGDVAGHGVSAVAAMTQVRASTRAFLFSDAEAGRVVGQVDRFITEAMPTTVASALVAVLDPASGTVRLAMAGHPRPFLLGGAGGRVELRIPLRPVLGFGGPDDAEELEVALGPGESLLMFSDGLQEQRDAGLDEARERFLAAVADGPGPGPLEPWVDRLYDAQLGEPDDDRTVLVLRRQG